MFVKYINFKFYLSLLFVLFHIHFLFSQPTRTNLENDKEDLLNTQIGDFQMHFEHLMGERGYKWYMSENINLETISLAIEEYNVDSTAVLFYTFQNDSLYIWAITSNGIEGNAVSLITKDELSEMEYYLKRAFAGQMSRGASVEESDKYDWNEENVLAKVSAVLFPIPIINALESYRYLIVVPALNIASFPLYALQPFPESADYVVDRKTLTIAHSLDDVLKRIYYYCNVLSLCDAKKNEFIPEYPFVIGNPDYSLCSLQFAQLPGAEVEAFYTASKFNSQIVKGFEATKAEVLSKITNSEFIYLATHGMADAESPLEKSYLVFTGDNNKDCGRLTAKEIQDLKLKTEAIVVLSACQTGLGKMHQGGIIGLGRAFLIAGAGNVFISLWEVNDKTTQELMKSFTDSLFEYQKFFPATSLRNAILNYKKLNPDPHAWAPFISMGMPYSALVKVVIK